MNSTKNASLDERKRLLTQTSDLISTALKTGMCEDLHFLEKRVCALANLGVNKEIQLKLMLDAGRFFYIAGRADRGLVVAEVARNFALEFANANSTASALTMMGICAADTGNLPLAMASYADAMSLAQKTGDLSREGRTWQNLGAALIYSGLFREAITCFSKALEFTKLTEELVSFRAPLSANIAACYLYLGDYAQGLIAIKKSVEYADQPADPNSILNRVLAENCYTRLLIEVNNFEGAREHAKVARQFALLARSDRADVSASVAEGLSEIYVSQVDIGLSRLERTLAQALSLKVNAHEILVALVKAHEHLGQHEKALEYLNKMLEAQRKTQEANVLEHVKRHLEQLHNADEGLLLEDASQAIKKLETQAEVFEGRVAKGQLKKLDQEIKNLDHELFKVRIEVMERLAVAAELRDDSTGKHSYRVGRMAQYLAKEIGLSGDEIFMIDIAARLHDIGKVGIPDGILLKPGPLNNSERDVMKTHATIGANVLAQSNIAHMKMAEDIARYHHEWWDGSGYPDGLVGEAIPLHARIAALADVFDALTHLRTYKPAWTIDSALTEILGLRGKQFDPKLTDVFLGLVSRLRREHGDLDKLLGAGADQSQFLLSRRKIQETLEASAIPGMPQPLSRFDLQR